MIPPDREKPAATRSRSSATRRRLMPAKHTRPAHPPAVLPPGETPALSIAIAPDPSFVSLQQLPFFQSPLLPFSTLCFRSLCFRSLCFPSHYRSILNLATCQFLFCIFNFAIPHLPQPCHRYSPFPCATRLWPCSNPALQSPVKCRSLPLSLRLTIPRRISAPQSGSAADQTSQAR